MGQSASSASILPAGPTAKGVEYWFGAVQTKLPDRVDLRRRDCFPYPVPSDQGSEGSCVAHATGAAFVCAQRRRNVPVARTDVPVVEALFREARDRSRVARDESKGITFSEAMKSLDDQATWFRLGRGLVNFKRCLARGFPVVLGFAVTASMKEWQDSDRQIRASEYVLPSRKSGAADVAGYHCVLLVGYDDKFRGGVFIARNSWGADWGHGGHFFFPYSLLGKPHIALDAMVLDSAA